MKDQNSKTHDLFVLMFNLSQLTVKETIIDIFIETLKKIWPDINATYQQYKPENEEISIEIAASNNNYGYLTFNQFSTFKMEDQNLLHNAIAILAVILSKNEQDNILSNEKLRLQKLVDDNIHSVLESETKYRNIFENIQDVYYETSIDGTILEVSPSIRVLSKDQYSREDIIGKLITDMYDTPDARQNVIKALKEKGHIDDFEINLKNRDGSLINCSITAIIRSDKQGVPLKIIGNMRNITERKNVEEALRISEEKFRNVFEHSVVGNSITTIDGNMIINEAFCDILGYSKDELSKLKWQEITPAEDIERDQNIMAFLISGEKTSVRWEKRFIYKNGGIVWVEISIALLRNEEGNPLYFITSIIDITDRKLSELLLREKTEQIESQNEEYKQINEELHLAKEKAEESDRLKTAFLHNISHEFRTPINAITGFSEFLNNPGLSPEKRKYFTEIIIQSSDQLLSIITDIVNIATIEVGQETITNKGIELNSILKQLHEQYELKAQNKKISLNLVSSLPDSEVNILSDETKLIQILSNLINNALKFTNKGYINYGYNVKGNELEFFVEDTGIGIPPTMHEEIFKRFHQVENATSRQFGGSGLGLSISKAYIELLGGKMWLTSELKKGSTFYFTIPYKKTFKKAILEKQPNKELEYSTMQPRTLLIAEDEDSNFMLLVELLSDLDVIIIRAINGLQAVNICKSAQHIDMVLMDIKMPIMDGYEATKQIREFKPDLPIIAQTAYTTDTDKNKALACGCSDFISKPFKQELFISKIKFHLNKVKNSE